ALQDLRKNPDEPKQNVQHQYSLPVDGHLSRQYPQTAVKLPDDLASPRYLTGKLAFASSRSKILVQIKPYFCTTGNLVREKRSEILVSSGCAGILIHLPWPL